MLLSVCSRWDKGQIPEMCSKGRFYFPYGACFILASSLEVERLGMSGPSHRVTYSSREPKRWYGKEDRLVRKSLRKVCLPGLSAFKEARGWEANSMCSFYFSERSASLLAKDLDKSNKKHGLALLIFLPPSPKCWDYKWMLPHLLIV